MKKYPEPKKFSKIYKLSFNSTENGKDNFTKFFNNSISDILTSVKKINF